MTPLPLVAAKFVPSLKTFSQEFHLRSHSTSPVEWLVGAMYFYANGGYDHISIAGRFQVFGLQKTESLAGFGQATIDVFENTKLTARSEEHTTELQSLMRISYAVLCLKKKKNTHKL